MVVVYANLTIDGPGVSRKIQRLATEYVGHLLAGGVIIDLIAIEAINDLALCYGDSSIIEHHLDTGCPTPLALLLKDAGQIGITRRLDLGQSGE